MNIENKIKNLLQDSLSKLKIEIPKTIVLQHPDLVEHGDFSSNLALALAKQEGKNPRELAEDILNNIEKDEDIEKVEVAGAGYLNFFLSKTFYKDYLNENNKNAAFVNKKRDTFVDGEFRSIYPVDNENCKNILLEHSSPNLFKPFHIGHLVNNSIGESLGRIIGHFGNHLKTLSFPSDVSPGIAKTIWAIKNQNLNIDNLTLQQIADAYVLGTKKYKEDEDIKKEINQINIDLYEKKEGLDLKIYNVGKNLSLEHFKEITKKLGSEFEDIIYESESEIEGKKIVLNNLNKVFVKSKESEAIIFEGSKYGLFDNVFINSDGFGTYLAKDLGLLSIKQKKNYFDNLDKSLVLTDVEQAQHFQLVKKSSSLVDELKEISEKSTYIQHGRMSFAGSEKISSRYGNVPLATDVISKVQQKVLDKMKERDFTEEEKKDISEKLAIGILKYSILKVSAGKNIVFDLDKDTDPKGNSASFLLYTFVRAKSIYNKKSEDKYVGVDPLPESRGDISDLEKILYRFDEEVKKSLDSYSPHHLANYLYVLSKKFNSFYENTKILDDTNPNFNYNFTILEIFGKTMSKGLDLLGIKTIDKM